MKKAVTIAGVMIAVHLILREIRKAEPTISYVESLPWNFHAITLPPIGIFIRSKHQANAPLLKHEMVHWRQYQRMGLLPYYWNYLKGMASEGYDHHPMEQEARANESSYCRDHYTECVRNGTAATIFDPQFRT